MKMVRMENDEDSDAFYILDCEYRGSFDDSGCGAGSSG
jgi:hypothetical protein